MSDATREKLLHRPLWYSAQYISSPPPPAPPQSPLGSQQFRDLPSNDNIFAVFVWGFTFHTISCYYHAAEIVGKIFWSCLLKGLSLATLLTFALYYYMLWHFEYFARTKQIKYLGIFWLITSNDAMKICKVL